MKFLISTIGILSMFAKSANAEDVLFECTHTMVTGPTSGEIFKSTGNIYSKENGENRGMSLLFLVGTQDEIEASIYTYILSDGTQKIMLNLKSEKFEASNTGKIFEIHEPSIEIETHTPFFMKNLL